MSRAIAHAVAIVLSSVVVALAVPAEASAAVGDGNTGGESDGGEAGGKVYAYAVTGGAITSTDTGSGNGSPRPACRWRLHIGTVTEIDVTGGSPYYRDANTRTPTEEAGPGVQVLYRVECPSGVSYRWATPSEYVDRQQLINAAYQYVTRDIPLPAINMSPRPEVGGVVNLGLWLAVDDPGGVSAVAEVGPVWAAVTARLTGMTWEMGNGDVVSCDGLGVPYPEGSNQIEQGPCGYTYTEQPPLDGYTITATGRWEVQLLTSDGVNQMLDPIDMPYTFAYDVDEIVTTGVG